MRYLYGYLYGFMYDFLSGHTTMMMYQKLCTRRVLIVFLNTLLVQIIRVVEITMVLLYVMKAVSRACLWRHVVSGPLVL